MNSAGLVLSLSVVFLCYWPTESYVKVHLTHRNIRSIKSPNPDSFLNDLFQKYGANGSMDINHTLCKQFAKNEKANYVK